MPHTFDPTSNADIYRYPKNIQTFGSNTKLELTTGNLYGNAMKLIYFLVTSGVMQVTESDYSILATIYQKDYKTLTDADIASFEAILNKPQTRFNAGAILRFTGGIVADEGVNNYSNLFILLVLKRLDLAAVQYKILFSKPDAWFIECCEGKKSFHRQPKPTKDSSAHNLHFILQDDIPPTESGPDPETYNKLSVTRQTILDIIEKAYKPHLQALSYTLSEDKTEIIIFSHTSIGLETIKSLSKELLDSNKYDNSSPAKLAKTIDRINDAFAERVIEGSITQAQPKKTALYSSTEAETFTQWLDVNENATTPEELSSPFKFPALIVLACNSKSDLLKRPAICHKKYFYQYVYGDHKCVVPREQKHVINLDNNNPTGGPAINTANYRALISVRHINDIPLFEAPRRLQKEISEIPPTQPTEAVIASSSAPVKIETAGIAALPQVQAVLAQVQASVPVDLAEKAEILEQEKDLVLYKTENSLTLQQAQAFFSEDIEAGLKTLQADILARRWITNMGGETIEGAATKVPKSIAKIYTLINNAMVDQNNHTVESANWFATRNLVVNLLEQAINTYPFTRDPQTHLWFKKVHDAGQEALSNSRSIINDPQIEDEKIAEIFNIIKQTALTGGQTILVEDVDGKAQSKKVPRTFEQIYSIIQKAQKDHNNLDIIKPNWEATRQKIWETSKTSAENRTYFRSDDTQRAIVRMVDSLTADAENFRAPFDRIKAEILGTENKQFFGYKVGFFSKDIPSDKGPITVSWKEKEILELIQQAQDGLLPAISAAEQISRIISESKHNLAFLNAANTDLTTLLNTPDLSSKRFEMLQGHIP